MMDDIEALKEYGEAEGTEVGDYLCVLCDFRNFISIANPEFMKAYHHEISEQLDFMKSNTKIIRTTETREIEVVDLEWLD